MPESNHKFAVNIDSAVAVYVQIENLVQFAIASGKYKPKDVLPSVREMSETLGLNPNTITKAYRDLEIMGVVTTRRGVGVSVSDKAPKLCEARMRAMVAAHLREAVSECMAAGLAAPEVRRIVTDAIESGLKPYRP